MQRAIIGWTVPALIALVMTVPADARPRAVSRDDGNAASAPAPSPPPAPRATPERPAPVVTSTSGARTAPASAAAASRAQSRGERRAPSGGGQATARPRPRGTDSTASTAGGRSGDGERTAVRRGDRPRDGRATIGTAVARTRPRPTIPSWAWHRPSYWHGYHSVGLGYFYYDPYWWGYPGYGYGHGYGYGYGPGYYGPGYGGYYVRGDRHLGNVRLKVKPRDAEVRVDGYYVGLVDQFDGVFQRLTLESGPHRIEIAKPGFEPLVIDIRVLPYDTITYRGTLQAQ
jgi:hypothetical protein